jgi:oligopeptide/dipeptide ABC transporter ATP-binding protein
VAESGLAVRDLSIRYGSRDASVYAADGVSFDIEPGRITALVGESGSGKTSVALSLLQLLPPNGYITSGTVAFRGQNILALEGEALRRLRGREIAMIFQDATAGLNPVIRVGDQVAELFINHLNMDKRTARRHAVDVLRSVGIGQPEQLADSYPFQLSGGMCQRVMVAIATALEPDILVADEPTSALDVTVQAQVLYELSRLAEEHGTGILLITHNLGVVAQVADYVAVMYGGHIVEQGTTDDVMGRPLHPYTHGLLAAVPRLDGDRQPLQPIGGELPDMTRPAERCVFLERCNNALSRCRAEPHPPLEVPEDGDHPVACYNPVWYAPED